MQPKSIRHRAALAYAAKGYPIFPVEVNGKRPVTDHGLRDATKHPAIIDMWWSAADYNLAVCPDEMGALVYDLDGDIGKESWAALCEKLGVEDWLPLTRTVATPRDGLHIWMAGSGPSTVGRFGAGIDTRGRGGYVLVPPSIIDGKPYVDLVDPQTWTWWE